MHRIALLILIIGIFHSRLSFAQAEGNTTFSGQNDTVYVEPTFVITTEKDGDYKLVPYRERRSEWGVTAALGYSSYEPVNYEPNFAAVDFVDLYTNPEGPMIELQVTVKRNLSIGSIGGEFAVGFYQNQADSSDIIPPDSTLSLTPIRLGGIFFLDAIGHEPFFVPYASGGVYTMSYSETMPGGSGHGGTTQAAFYFHGGVQMMLDWIDRSAARRAYEESGIEASYVYAEARKQMASDNERDPDFEGDISWAVGIRAEF